MKPSRFNSESIPRRQIQIKLKLKSTEQHENNQNRTGVEFGTHVWCCPTRTAPINAPTTTSLRDTRNTNNGFMRKPPESSSQPHPSTKRCTLMPTRSVDISSAGKPRISHYHRPTGESIAIVGLLRNLRRLFQICYTFINPLFLST